MTSLNPEMKDKADQISKAKFKHTILSNEFIKQMVKLSWHDTYKVMSETGKHPKATWLYPDNKKDSQEAVSNIDIEPPSAL